MSRVPVVSVVIPVWNVERYLAQCLDSVLAQSIGLERIEVLAIDDGSTDSSGALLDGYAARYPQLRVFHEPNSGGPGRPRNVGLDHAAGRYVYFLDADDYLGGEALERMVAMAERNESDVVLGRLVGIGGRLVSTYEFRHNRDRARLRHVYPSLNVFKLFSRALIEKVGARFAEGLAANEDGTFTEHVYLAAKVISVVADYDCYYYRLRPASQTQGAAGPRDLVAYLSVMAERIALLTRSRRPGIPRDLLMIKHISAVLDACDRRCLALPPPDQERLFHDAGALIRSSNTSWIQAGLFPPQSIRAYCLEHDLIEQLKHVAACSRSSAFGNPVFDGRRVFARYPHFRDGSGIPDACFEITDRIHPHQRVRRAEIVDDALVLRGEAFLTYLGGSTTILLRRRGRRPIRLTPDVVATPELRDRHAHYRRAGFSIAVDLATADRGRPLRSGRWDILLSVGPAELQLTAPLGRPQASDHPSAGGQTRHRVTVEARRGQFRLGTGSARRTPTLNTPTLNTPTLNTATSAFRHMRRAVTFRRVRSRLRQPANPPPQPRRSRGSS